MWDVSGALGKFFFVAGLLPAMAFFAACDLVIVPRFFGGLHLVGIELLATKGAVYLIGGTFLGFLLLSLNTPIIKLYENGLFISAWLRRRNHEQHRQRYTALVERRRVYQQIAETVRDQVGDGAHRAPAAQAADEPNRTRLKEAIDKLSGVHRAVERKHGDTQRLPHDIAFIMPTALGNAFAVIEEYPYERYGMDAMVYWPRLAAVIPEDYRSQIADLKTTLDFLLNLSLLAWAFGVIALGLAAWFLAIPELVYGLLALAAAYGLYRIAVGSARELGGIVAGSFDLFRGVLLDKYGLPKPTSLRGEQRLWLLLASFIQRGEAFYYPLEEPTTDDYVLIEQELRLHSHNLYKLQEQAAIYGAGMAPLHLLNQIENEERVMKEIEAKMGVVR